MISRRECIKWAIAGTATAGLATRVRAQGAAKVPQTVAQYQETPKNDQKCDLCKYFTAGSSPTANGTCQLVEGSINPNGWCALFAAKG